MDREAREMFKTRTVKRPLLCLPSRPGLPRGRGPAPCRRGDARRSSIKRRFFSRAREREREATKTCPFKGCPLSRRALIAGQSPSITRRGHGQVRRRRRREDLRPAELSEPPAGVLAVRERVSVGRVPARGPAGEAGHARRAGPRVPAQSGRGGGLAPATLRLVGHHVPRRSRFRAAGAPVQPRSPQGAATRQEQGRKFSFVASIQSNGRATEFAGRYRAALRGRPALTLGPPAVPSPGPASER